MVNTSNRPLEVDGVRLDTLAWNITKLTRGMTGRRTADQELPGRDGVLPSLNDTLEPGLLGLEMFVMGTDADGAVPPEGRRDTYQRNLDELLHLFGKRHALLDVREKVSDTEWRRAWAKVTDRIEPDQDATGSWGELTVALSLPFGVWEDPDTQDWTSGPLTSGQVLEVPTLTGATERIEDAVVVFNGPAPSGVRITDPATGAYVEHQAAITAGQSWRVNVGTWATRRGSVGLGSNDTTGTDANAVTRFGGMVNQAAFLPLTPVRLDGTRKVRVQVTGDGFTASSTLSIRARRKFAL